MKQALCLQHVPFEGPGAFRQALEKRQYQLDTLLVPQRELPATPPDFLLVMGGPMSVNDSDPWIEKEQKFIRHAIEAGIPVLGVCLGSQFMAKALGGQVRPGPRLEIGPTLVTRTVEEDADAVFGTFPRQFTVFEWHGEGLTLPPGRVSSPRPSSIRFKPFDMATAPTGSCFIWNWKSKASKPSAVNVSPTCNGHKPRQKPCWNQQGTFFLNAIDSPTASSPTWLASKSNSYRTNDGSNPETPCQMSLITITALA